MEDYVETFFESHVWDTNWKVLAENFMESYHLPVCHAGTIGGLSKLDEMVCPPGLDGLQLPHDPQGRHAQDRARAPVQHPPRGRAAADDLPARDLPEPARHPDTGLLLVSDAPSRRGRGRSASASAAACRPTSSTTRTRRRISPQLKTLLDEVNVEDRGCTEKVYRGLSSQLARPGHLSHLERPNYDFARYLAARVAAR